MIARGEIVAEGSPDGLKADVADGRVVEIEAFGVGRGRSSGCARVEGVRSVGVEPREQAQVLVVQTRARASSTHALLGAARRSAGRARERARAALEDAYVALVREWRGRARLPDARAEVEDARRALAPHDDLAHLRRRVADEHEVVLRRPLRLHVLVEPLIMATIAFYTARTAASPEALFYLAIGAGVLGIWSSTLFGSGGAISWQRWEGTLELLVASPPSLLVIVVPLTVATASIGIYSLAATLLWGRFVFGIPLELAHPLCSRSACRSP